MRRNSALVIAFEQGFQAGLKAGYSDGYSGRLFRAVDSLRSVAASLEETRPHADPKFIYFDEGFFSGYNEGFDRGGSDQSSTAQVDFHFVGCANFHPARHSDPRARKAIAKATAEVLRWAMPMVFCCVLRVAGWKPASNPE